MTNSENKLALIRAALKQNGIDVCIIPLSDPHLSENIPEYCNIIRWLTGFSGSSATVVITSDFAGLWTDSRYFIQAQNELSNTGFMLVKPDPFRAPDFVKWIGDNLARSGCVGFDGRLISVDLFRRLQESLKGKSARFDTDFDPVSSLWNDRPLTSSSPAWDHPVRYAGKDRSAKLLEVKREMASQSADYHLITSPDDIMWLLNIRGGDALFTPVLKSFALIGTGQTLLFADETRIPHDLAEELDKQGIITLPYEETAGMLTTLPEGKSILVDPKTTSVALWNSVPAGCRIIENSAITAKLKAIKNKTEIENISKVMVRDGVALTRFFHYVETNFGIVPMTELSLSVKLHEYRSQQSEFLGPSFMTITAFNEHAALPHYKPSPETDFIVSDKGILLVDSGGQFMGGTTDITRTIPIGAPTLQQKKDFSLVLKGHISLAMMKFPLGTKGYQIDMQARKALWDNGLDYGHGTGHGVGYCLSVHEGPQSISSAAVKVRIEPGMLISNEPALYREGEYGIRTENLMICYEDEETDFGTFLKFDTMSLCYIDKLLIDKSLLDKYEIDWINSYHADVFEKISPYLNSDEKVWLKDKTDPL